MLSPSEWDPPSRGGQPGGFVGSTDPLDYLPTTDASMALARRDAVRPRAAYLRAAARRARAAERRAGAPYTRRVLGWLSVALSAAVWAVILAELLWAAKGALGFN